MKHIRIMKIFEVAWLTIAVIALIMAFVKLTGSDDDRVYSYFLFFITFLGVMMFLIKRKSRKFTERKYREREEQAAATDSYTNNEK